MNGSAPKLPLTGSQPDPKKNGNAEFVESSAANAKSARLAISSHNGEDAERAHQHEPAEGPVGERGAAAAEQKLTHGRSARGCAGVPETDCYLFAGSCQPDQPLAAS